MGVGGQSHAPATLPPGKRPVIHCTGGWVGPRAGLDGCWKSRPHRDLIPGPSRESLCRLRCPGSRMPLGARERLVRFRDPPGLLFNGYCGFFSGVKRPEQEVDHYSPPSAKVNNEWNYTSTPPPICHNVVDREKFIFYTLPLVSYPLILRYVIWCIESHIGQCWVIGRLVDNELDMTWTEAAMD